MPKTTEPKNYWELAPLWIAGMDRVDELLEAGRVEEARDHFISCARAIWQHRWRSIRHYTLKRLGEALDTERYPQLAAISSALQQEAPGSARRFLDYLRGRKTPDISPFIVKPQPPAKEFNPAQARSLDAWSAWAATGEERFKERLDAVIAQYLDPVNVISWHESSHTWASFVMSALVHGGIEDETLCKLILFGLDNAEQSNATSHLSEPPQTSVGGNHLLAWISGWLRFTILFPEFRRTPALLHAVLARLDDEVSLQVMPDGSMIEGAPGYENCCIWGASDLLWLTSTYGIELPDRVHKAWERMLWFAIGLMKPNGCIPMLGDSQDEHVAGYAGQMPKFYSFPELKWTVSGGKEGHPPAFTSKAFECIGYYVQRTGWTPESLYLCFDGGRFGQAHQHEDKLHFELYAYGRMFLVDAGVHSYSEHWFRRWSVLAQAHNTILVDGLGQCRWREDRDRWFSHIPLKNRWQTGEAWDTVEADFDGPYEKKIGPVRQRRRVIFHRDDPPFWWVTDWAEGDGPHEITELFHFAHDIEKLDDVEGGVLTRIAGGPNLALLCLYAGGKTPSSAPHKLATPRYRGEQDPPRGWNSPKLYTVEPAWEVHFSGCAELPLRRDFLLLPWRGELRGPVQAQLDLSTKPPRLRLQVDSQQQSIDLPEA